jgi:hypothetical protein
MRIPGLRRERTPKFDSATVNVGNCQTTDSDQRQFMTDPRRGDWRHAADASRRSDDRRETRSSDQRVKYQAMTTRMISAISAMVTRERGI